MHTPLQSHSLPLDSMSIDEHVRQTLVALGDGDAEAIAALFAEVRAAMSGERRALIERGAGSESERAAMAKALRDRWLARYNRRLSQAMNQLGEQGRQWKGILPPGLRSRT